MFSTTRKLVPEIGRTSGREGGKNSVSFLDQKGIEAHLRILSKRKFFPIKLRQLLRGRCAPRYDDRLQTFINWSERRCADVVTIKITEFFLEYNLPAPEYNHPAPEYNHPAPEYNHPAPEYNLPAPLTFF